MPYKKHGSEKGRGKTGAEDKKEKRGLEIRSEGMR